MISFRHLCVFTVFFFFQAEDGIRDPSVTGVQTCALPICRRPAPARACTRQRRTDADAYTLSLEQVGDRVDEAWAAGATEICMQGGIHPDLPGTAYFDLAEIGRASRRERREMSGVLVRMKT